MSGELIKLRIKAYSDEEFKNEVDIEEFRTLINPEKYSFKYKIELNKDQPQGTSAAAPQYVRTLPEDIDLEFVFDRTGVFNNTMPSSSNEEEDAGIMGEIDHFKKVVFDYNGDNHKPNYLIITWGTLLFKCMLSEMDITYKLFKPDGTPLRALVRAKFKGFVEDVLRVAKEDNNSPDLTHVRMVKEGDTLPLMTFRIYGDSKYYLEVARANKIRNFRSLQVGQEIFFPPLN